MERVDIKKIDKFYLDPLHGMPHYNEEKAFSDFIMQYPSGKKQIKYFNGNSTFSPNCDLVVGCTYDISISLIIDDGMYNKHCYANTGTRIYLNVIADNTPMGGIVKGLNSVNLYIKTAGTAPIAKVELISNKGVSLLYSYKNNAREYTTDYKLEVANDLKWAYIRVTQIDRNMAFVSPIFFD